MSLVTRSYEKEFLDNDNIPFSDIQPCMQELNTINTFLGGHNTTCKGVDYFLHKIPVSHTIVIAEIGCGGGDNLSSIRNFLDKRKRASTLIGVDIKAECVQHAGQRFGSGMQWICSDYRTVNWKGEKPDIIFSSLFCHHFTDEQLVKQLQWLKENSRIGFFINDLHRHPVAYHSVKLLTGFFSSSYLVKNDAPLSVKRGFKKNDWVNLLSRAGITGYKIDWHWAFRYLICAAND